MNRTVTYNRLLAVALNIVWLPASVAWAEEASSASDNARLEAVQVTTATKTERRLDEVPVQTTVVSRKEIEKFHAQNLAEALKYVPGIQLKPILGKNGKGVWMQGFDPERVLILVDGNPVSPSTGSTVDVTQVAIGDVERIEIIKGATSALYGTSAMGGVVNVITRSPTSDLHFSADVSGGNWGDESERHNPVAKKKGNFEVSTKQDNWYGQLVADLNLSDGYQAIKDNDAVQGWYGHKNTYSGKFQYEFDNDLKVTLMPRYYDEDAATKISSGSVQRDLTETKFLSGVVEQKLDNDWQWKVRAMWEGYENEAQKTIHRKTDSSHSEVAAQLDIPLAGVHFVSVGAELKRDTMDVKNLTADTQEVDNEHRDSTQMFAQDSWFVTPNLEILPGVRLDNDSGYGTHVSPMLNAMYSRQDWLPGRVNIRAGVGNGYRTPNLKELYYVFDQSAHYYMVMGNEDLKPEESISYQLGLEWAFSNQGSIEVSAFHNDITNLIDTAFTGQMVGPVAVYQYQNIDRAMTQGGEVVFRSALGSYFHLVASYYYVNARDEETKKRLVNRPEHEVKVGLDTYVTNDATFTVQMNYQSDEYVDTSNDTTSPGYTTWDMILNYDIDKSWQTYVGVNNLTDEQTDFSGTDLRPEEGRYYYLGLRYQYTK